jgi:hypothetical protein
MRLSATLAIVLTLATGCAATSTRDLESPEWLCFGTEHARWNALDLKSGLASQLMELAAIYEPLALREEPPRAVILVNSRGRHAVLCKLGQFPSRKGCVAEKWNLFLDRYDRWFSSGHFAEQCQSSEEVIVTS